MVLTLKSKKYLGGDVFGLQVLGKWLSGLLTLAIWL
jgi:hypothetical protein